MQNWDNNYFGNYEVNYNYLYCCSASDIAELKIVNKKSGDKNISKTRTSPKSTPKVFEVSKDRSKSKSTSKTPSPVQKTDNNGDHFKIKRKTRTSVGETLAHGSKSSFN